MLTILIAIIFHILSSYGIVIIDVAEPIEIPKLGEIESVRVGDSTARTDDEIKQTAIEFLQSAVPTMRQSANDTPNAEEYSLFMLISTANECISRGYFYEIEYLFGLVSRWYYEIPYYGIYEVSESHVETLLLEFNQEL